MKIRKEDKCYKILTLLWKNTHKALKARKKLKAEGTMEWLTLEINKVVTIQREIQYQHWEKVHLAW